MLVALLFGNVAGWVHIGCSHHSLGCCSETLANSAKSPSGNPVADDHGEHCCCHHECGATGAGEAAEFLASESETPADQHDPDTCSVCQSFFASRHASTLVDPVLTIERLAISRDVALVDDVFTADDYTVSHTVRGPPSV